MSCPECRGYTLMSACPCCSPEHTGDPLEDAYRDWLATQPADVQRRMREAMEPDYQGIHEDQMMARAEKRRAREER